MPTSRTSALTGNNQQFTVHILQHQRENEAPRYTVSVWEESQLRAICHVSSLSGALLALSGELESTTPSQVPVIAYPKWSDIRELVEKLRGRKDSDSVAAADDLEDLQCRLHNAVGNFEVLLDHATKIGAVLEEAAANSHCVGDPQWTTVAIPEDIWFRLLAVYRGKQESNSIYSELQLLREIAGITAQTIRTIENWLGHAGTRESAMDSLWRLARILQAAGYRIPMEGLEWRGQLVRAMEQAGVALGEDGALRVRQSEEKYWLPATGPLVKDLLHAARQAI